MILRGFGYDAPLSNGWHEIDAYLLDALALQCRQQLIGTHKLNVWPSVQNARE